MSNRRRRRWPLIAGVTLGLLGIYVASYAILSRRGMAEVRGTNGFFFYCPLADVKGGRGLPTQHILCVGLFRPINELDRLWFGGESPCRGVTWGLQP